MTCISWVTISANRMRSTSAAITPMTMTFLRCSAGRPAASAPTTIALSPASTRSIISTWKKAANAAGSVMLEKSLTIDAQMSAGPAESSCGRRGRGGQQHLDHRHPLIARCRAKAHGDGRVPYWFIEAKKSSLDLASFILSSRNCIASTVPICIRIRRSTHILLSLRRVDQQFFLAGAGLADVERREDALVADLAVEHDFASCRCP